jgi:hypothetical protein
MVTHLLHRIEDKAQEYYRVHVLNESPRGSTGRGITPAFSDEVNQRAIYYQNFLGSYYNFAKVFEQRINFSINLVKNAYQVPEEVFRNFFQELQLAEEKAHKDYSDYYSSIDFNFSKFLGNGYSYNAEKIIDAYVHDRKIETTEAVAAIGAIYGRLRAALNELPEHPRLLPRREFIDTQGAVRAVTASLRDRESNAQLEGTLAAPNLRIEMEQYQGASHSRRMSWLSYAQLDFIHTCLSESALQPSGEVPPALFVSLLAEINEKLIDKLAMLHGDGMENIAGTNLFVPRERKAISRAAIEHALLTSTSEQCHETLKVGALMIAIGGGVLTLQELRELGHNIDCIFFVLSHEEQLQTGLRILKLLPGLTEGDRGLQSVLQAYSRDGLTVEGMGPEALNLCKQIYGHRRDLSRS